MKDQDPCPHCETPVDIRYAIKVNGAYYCSEFCAQQNLPVIGGNIPQEVEEEPVE